MIMKLLGLLPVVFLSVLSVAGLFLVQQLNTPLIVLSVSIALNKLEDN